MSRILIVEDEEILADSLQDILRAEGHQVRTTYNGREALEVLKHECAELVLLDMMLPVVDGGRVLETLRRDCPATAVLVVTSTDPHILRGQSVEGFLRKPFSLDDLLLQVRLALKSPAD
jgi:CheY-like chemotaxis protein